MICAAVLTLATADMAANGNLFRFRP
jgi:hypothetical protein